MKRRRFMTTLVASAAFTSGVATACNSSSQTADGGGSGGSQGKKLVMATSADYPPYEFVDTSKGSQDIIGFDVDIAKAVADKLGYSLEISNIDFNGLIPALQAGRADFVMAGMTPTEERKKNVDFSEVYYTAKQTILSPKSAGISNPKGLDGKKVGVQLGSIQEKRAQELKKAGSNMEIMPLNRITEIVQELKAGRIDAAIIEDTVAQGFLKSNSDLQATVIPTEGPVGSAIAFPKGSKFLGDVNKALADMKSSGQIEELVKKWFGDR